MVSPDKHKIIPEEAVFQSPQGRYDLEGRGLAPELLEMRKATRFWETGSGHPPRQKTSLIKPFLKAACLSF